MTNGLFKHPDIEAMRNPEEDSQDELDARAAGLSFVSMNGNIGCIVNGAGPRHGHHGHYQTLWRRAGKFSSMSAGAPTPTKW